MASFIDEKETFEATYAVSMKCNDCIKDIKLTLEKVKGVHTVEFNLQHQIILVNGVAPPSSIAKALKPYCSEIILRGTGKPNSSAVAILEISDSLKPSSDAKVGGLVRILNVSPTKTLFDITINGMSKPGEKYTSIRQTGDISKGFASVGPAIHKFEPILCNEPSDMHSGLFRGQAFLAANIPISKLIGRSFMITTDPERFTDGSDLLGVIARSAGAWENNKQVCSCSGKTIWQERSDTLDRNITD